MRANTHIKIILLIINITWNSIYAINIQVHNSVIENITSKAYHVLPNDISFLIADLKYDGNTIKILELGNGPNSGFKGHEKLYGPNKIKKQFKTYLSQFKLPVFSVNEKTLNRLKTNPLFRRHCSPIFSHKNKYSGIISIRYFRVLTENKSISRLKKYCPQFLILNNTTGSFANNKHKTAAIFDEINLSHYKPLWKIYNINTPNIASTIIRDFPNISTFVIKPTCSKQGYGINIVQKNDLPELLKELFPKRTIADNFWTTHSDTQFIVEEYVHSKPTKISDKEFDGTMRVAFILDHTKNKINLTFLGSYWKLPIKALNEPGSLNERCKSKISDNRICSAKVSEADYEHVKSYLKDILPKMYTKMIEKNAP